MEQLDSSQRTTQLIASQEIDRAKRMAFPNSCRLLVRT